MSRRTSLLFLLTCCASGNRRIPGASGFSSAPRRPGPPPPAATAARGARRATLAPLSAAASSPAAHAVRDCSAALDRWYDEASAIKCPFFRRRAADLVDGAAQVARFLLVRHKSLPGLSDHLLAAPGCKPLGWGIKRRPDGTADKARGRPLAEVARRLRGDWTGGRRGPTKGYYITGRLDSAVYRDDCRFTGPDPDMPVRGLRKYLAAAAHLFDPRESDAELLSLAVHENAGGKGCGMCEVTWRLGGVIQLPWHPTVAPWTGTTRYHLDEEGLIYWHEEGWDISVWRAFICTVVPEARSWRVWGSGEEHSGNSVPASIVIQDECFISDLAGSPSRPDSREF